MTTGPEEFDDGIASAIGVTHTQINIVPLTCCLLEDRCKESREQQNKLRVDLNTDFEYSVLDLLKRD